MNETEQIWNKMAAAYEDFTSDADSYSLAIEWPCIQTLLPNLEGKSVIDLGCGSGRFTFLLEAKKPARITGADLSGEMLALARKRAAALNSAAKFIKADISKRFAAETFDFAFSSTVTHYIADLGAFFRGVSEMLPPRGECLFSVMHPLYTAQYPVRRGNALPDDGEWAVRYLDKRERACIQPWIEYNDEIENFPSFCFHHTFGDYLNALCAAGLGLTDLREPLPPKEWKSRFPQRYEAFIETPSFLIFKAKKI